LASALPEKEELDKNRRRLEICEAKNKNLRVMGIDLGDKNPFAYVISDTVVNSGLQTFVSEGIFDKVYEYDGLLRDIRGFRDLLNYARFAERVCSISDEAIIVTANAINMFREKIPGHVGMFWTQTLTGLVGSTALEAIEKMRETCKSVDTEDKAGLKKQRDFLPVLIHKYLEYGISRITEEGRYKQEDRLDGLYQRCELLRSWLSALRAWSTLWQKGRVVTFNKIVNRLEQTVKTTHQQTTARIIKIALENKVDVIVFENLDLKRERGDRQKNRRFMTWSPAKLQEYVVNAAEMNGIKVQFVMPECTSQYDFDSKQFGYRHTKSRFLYVPIKGAPADGTVEEKYRKVESDVNAAKNISQRFCDRHRSMPVIITPKGKNGEGEKEGGVIFRGQLTAHFGSVEDGLAAIKEINGGEIGKNIYLHDGKWISLAEHKKIQKKIQAEVEPEKPEKSKNVEQTISA
jgi:IS605 OrfB family transposase